MSRLESFDYQAIAADTSGDLGYIVGIEHTTASVAGAAPEAYSLRVTTVFRRENDEWKVVHRHGDPIPDSPSTQEQLDRLSTPEHPPMSKYVAMQNLPSTNRGPISSADAGTRPSIWRSALILALVVFGVFYMMLAMGGASFVHECQTVVCGQLHQAVFAAIGALALFVGAYQLFEGKSSAAKIVFIGTVPILVVHVILVMTDPNEAIFFPLSTTPPPLISGGLLVYRAARRTRNVAEQS